MYIHSLVLINNIPKRSIHAYLFLYTMRIVFIPELLCSLKYDERNKTRNSNNTFKIFKLKHVFPGKQKRIKETKQNTHTIHTFLNFGKQFKTK